MKEFNIYTEDDYLLLSGIQHFSFCRRQWALIHLEQLWNENILTAEGRLNHEKVHNSGKTDIRNGVLTTRGMQIKSASLGLTGQCDAVEFLPSEDGTILSGRKGKWDVRPIEYKHGSAKNNDCDRLQVVAQAMCLEEMLCCSISEALIFYHETRKRETVIITNEMRDSVKKTVAEMHELNKRHHTPNVKKSKKCRNCSLHDICLPELFSAKGSRSAKAYIDEYLRGEDI